MKFTESSFSAGMRLGPAASHWPWLNVHTAERMVHSLGAAVCPQTWQESTPRCSNGEVAQDLCNQANKCGAFPLPLNDPPPLCNSHAHSRVFSICWMFQHGKKENSFKDNVCDYWTRSHVGTWGKLVVPSMMAYLLRDYTLFLIKQTTGFPESYEDV